MSALTVNGERARVNRSATVLSWCAMIGRQVHMSTKSPIRSMISLLLVMIRGHFCSVIRSAASTMTKKLSTGSQSLDCASHSGGNPKNCREGHDRNKWNRPNERVIQQRAAPHAMFVRIAQPSGENFFRRLFDECRFVTYIELGRSLDPLSAASSILKHLLPRR